MRHLARNIAVVGTIVGGLLLTGGASQAVEVPELPLPVPVPEVPGVPDLPSIPGLPDLPTPDLPLPDSDSGPDNKLPNPRPKGDLPSPPAAPCSADSPVTVDQSDVAFTTITISFECETETSFHKVVSASVAGTTILEIDTSTVLAGYGAHATTIRVPKAEVCLTDVLSDEEKCLP